MSDETKITPDIYNKFLVGLMDELIPFYVEKNKSYGNSGFRGDLFMSVIGNWARQSEKVLRLERMIKSYSENKGELDKPFGESIYDTMSDILGYAVQGMAIAALYDPSSKNFWEYVERGKKIDLNNSLRVPTRIESSFSAKNLENRDMGHPFGYHEDDDGEVS